TAGVAGVVAVTVLVLRRRDQYPLVASAWVIYLTLLSQVAGLTPSGLQATADRYMYVPSVVIAIGVGCILASTIIGPSMRRGVLFTSAAAIGWFAFLAWNQTHYWKSSVTLWSRATELDPDNDVGTYSLSVALA